MEQSSTLLWLTPTLGALFVWGIAQGLVKKYIGEVPPARFCFFYAIATALVALLFFAFSSDRPPLLAAEGRTFLSLSVLVYVLDGIAWICYYESIVSGPISIVGTLSAAYPGLTVLFARIFLDEKVNNVQYAGVAAIIGGCLMLAYSPPDPNAKVTSKRWIPLAAVALLLWGINQVILKHAYTYPNAHEGNLYVAIAIGALVTLGVYGLRKGDIARSTKHEVVRAAFPMATMALGTPLVALATKYGPASLVTPLSGAYPIVTLAFAGIVLKERPSPIHWIGIVFVFIGLGCVTSTDWAPMLFPAEQALNAA
jgi:bacterial/archaeal transporter family protein